MTSAVAARHRAPKVPQWTFADRMRKIRRDVLNVEQSEFAEQLGVTRQAYAAWESGRTQPRNILGIARTVEELSGVPAAWLLAIDSRGGLTGVDTGEYTPGSASPGPQLSLVGDSWVGYCDVDHCYGSSTAGGAHADGWMAVESAPGVNDAHAA